MRLVAIPAYRWTVYALLFAFFALSMLGNVGGPELLGEAQFAIWGLILIVWFGTELRGESGPWIRRLLWFGIASGVLLIVGTVGELVAG
jgi:hypothetical protein